jgi:hypothetical protein
MGMRHERAIQQLERGTIAGSIAGVTASAAEVNKNAGVTAGTVTASKTVVAGASKDVDTLLVNLFKGGLETGLTAHAGGGQGSALALSVTKSIHNVTVVATANDSVALPLATGSGAVHWVKNSDSTDSLQLFGSGTDTIDGVATGTGVAIAAGKGRICIDIASGAWISMLSA